MSYNNTSSQDKSIPGSGIDPKFLIQIIEEFNALSKNPEKLLEYVNASADYGRYVLGINVMPASWQLRDGELKFIPHGTWKEYQDNPIPEQTHQEWKNTGAFLRGIAGILGKVFHRPDKVGYYLSQVDMDNAPAISEIIRWKGDKSLAEFGKRGLVTQHTAKLDSSAKIYIYSKTPLKNKDPDVSKDDTNLPSWEIHCLGRMAIMPGSRHRKHDPVIVTKDGVLEPITLSDETEQRTFEEYSNNLCIKYGLNPYLYNGHGNGNGKSTSNNGYRDTEPLEPEIQRMLFKVGNYDENVVINQDHRHVTMVKVANSILWTYSDDEQFTDDIQSLKDWFILINDHCCKLPLEISERDRIWSDTVDYVGKQKSLQNQCVLTVSDAIREQPGANKSVRGTIFSVSAIFKVATQLYYRCSCGSVIGSPIKGISLYWEKYLDRRCPSCNEEGLNLDFNASKFNDAKIVVLQNVDLTSDLDETLEVLLLGEHTKDVKAGEVVVVRGSLKYGPSNLGRHSKNKKTIALLTAKFLNYEGRQNIAITDSDVKSFHRFARLNQHIDVIQRLVNMTAPNVIGEEPYKLGILRSVVGGLDNQRRGRIHTLSVGDKGLAKSLVIREATKMKPNARMITVHSASSTSALGIIDSTNDVKTLIYGPIPLSSGSIVGIDELQSWTHDNQGILLNVMEEGRFGLLKYARDKSIIAETTIIATANPQDIEYENRDSISVKEINLLAPLRDRFDQIYIALDEIDEQKDWEYSENRIKYTRTRKPHNYNFITKYLIYAEDIKPELTREARVSGLNSENKNFLVGECLRVSLELQKRQQSCD